MKVLIVGGVAGGASAAARLRRLDEQAEIIMFERTGHVSYANCGLPYFIGDVITARSALTLQTPESFRSRFAIDVRVHSAVTAIDRAAKTVTVQNLDTGEIYREGYDKLILSPGAQAIRPNLPGIDDPRIFTLRTVEDTYRIKDHLTAHPPRTAVVVGGGFVGLEMAENLVALGAKTTLVEAAPQVLPPIDYDMACEVHAYLRSKGLTLQLGAPVSGFRADGQSLCVSYAGGETAADVVVLAIGVRPDTAIAKAAGLALGAKDSIAVDAHMRTSDPDIYAVGDAVEVKNNVTGAPALIPLAGPANKQGRIAADNLCGRDRVYRGSLGTSVVKLFDMTVAATGLNEKSAAGVAYDKVLNYAASHATYYPGANNLSLKTLFDPATGRILGCQIVGFDGVDKRIDVMAVAVREALTGAELAELELAYAPPFSSAKDPVNMAGFTIENVREGLVRQYHWHEIPAIAKDPNAVFLDVRFDTEFAAGHIPGAINIPLDSLRARIGELSREKTYYVNCHSGLRSYIACRILTGHGFLAYNLSGGHRFYAIVAASAPYDADPTYLCGVKLPGR
ncbi:MAG: FAD-dependent oxidoreductase [Oscillospiraceae bacterium]|nr:FAD-dependent oxidoreductase [Oscillospiraceae bacterium]